MRRYVMKREYFGYVFAVALLAGLWAFALNRGGKENKEPTLAEQIAAYEAAWVGSPEYKAQKEEARRFSEEVKNRADAHEQFMRSNAYYDQIIRDSNARSAAWDAEEAASAQLAAIRQTQAQQRHYAQINAREIAAANAQAVAAQRQQTAQLAADQAALRAQLQQETDERKALQFQQEQNAAYQQRKIRQIEQERNWEWVNSHPARGK